MNILQICGRVLRTSRITIEYRENLAYWLREPSGGADEDVDYLGGALIFKQGEHVVGALTTQDGKPAVKGIWTGDKSVRTYKSREALYDCNAIGCPAVPILITAY